METNLVKKEQAIINSKKEIEPEPEKPIKKIQFRDKISILCCDDNSMVMMNFLAMKLEQTNLVRKFAKHGKDAIE